MQFPWFPPSIMPYTHILSQPYSPKRVSLFLIESLLSAAHLHSPESLLSLHVSLPWTFGSGGETPGGHAQPLVGVFSARLRLLAKKEAAKDRYRGEQPVSK